MIMQTAPSSDKQTKYVTSQELVARSTRPGQRHNRHRDALPVVHGGPDDDDVDVGGDLRRRRHATAAAARRLAIGVHHR